MPTFSAGSQDCGNSCPETWDGRVVTAATAAPVATVEVVLAAEQHSRCSCCTTVAAVVKRATRLMTTAGVSCDANARYRTNVFLAYAPGFSRDL